MKAVIFKNKKLSLSSDYPLPRPKKYEALIRVTYAGICATDLEIVKEYMGFEGIPGHEFVGIVKECNHRNLVGKRVCGEINIACGQCDYCQNKMERHCPQRSVLGIVNKDGAFAEYVTLPIKNLHSLPDTISDEEAVFIEPLAAAFEVLEQIDISASHDVCILGDGRLGNLTAQVLATTGCNLVVMGKHENKLALLISRGIKTRLVTDNYTEDSHKFDIVIDCTGSPSGLDQAMNLIRPKGTIILKTTVASERTFDFNKLIIDEITLLGSRCGPFEPAIKALAENKVDVNPLISKVFSLYEGIEAFKFAAKKGVMKVQLKM